MLKRYEELFSACFPPSSKFSPESLNWLYKENPDGHVVGFDAVEGGELAGHYVCIPSQAKIAGTTVKTLLSLNTATHPKFQGKGLFTKLAEMTYQAAGAKGVEGVYGIGNANSTPGFVRKLGFQLVQPLEAKIGVGRLNIDFDVVAKEAQFERVWTQESLLWRSCNPCNRVWHSGSNDRLAFHTAAFGNLLPAYAELAPHITSLPRELSRRVASPARLFLGLVPRGSCRFGGYMDIPQRLRPSPLNMIYRSLTTQGVALEPGKMSFSFLDFDAY